MKKVYLLLMAFAATLLGSLNATAQERIRVDLNVDNMDWVYWNSNSDKTLAWGRQAKTIDGYDIYLSAVSYAAAPDNSQSPNNMAFWDKQHLQLYALWGSRHPLNYELNCLSGDYKIVEIGMDFVVGTHPVSTPSVAEYGVSVSLAGEEAVACYSTTEPAHVEVTDLDGTSATVSVDYVDNEGLNGKVNCVFANTTSFYVILEELDDWTKARNALNTVINDYSTYASQMSEQVGTEPGQYSPALVDALVKAIDDANMLEDPSKPDPTLEQLQEAQKAIVDAYEAALASKIGLSISDGYYRIRSSMEYHNDVATGETDENGTAITETKYMYKYLMSYAYNGGWRNIWENRDESVPEDEAMILFKVTNKENGLIDLFNMGSETRLSSAPKSGYAVSTTDSEQLIWLEPAKTADGVTSVYICLADQKSQPVAPNGMVALHQTGHSSGAGVDGWVIGWWANDGNPVEPSMWVFEPVSDEEAQEVMAAWLPVKEHKQLVADYKTMYADAKDKLFKAKDYILGDELVTDAEQLSSPWTEASEGNLPALIDGSSTTYWHSAWSGGNVPPHTHYLQVALPEAGYQLVEMKITRRPVTNDHVILWGVFGSNDPEAADEDWTDLGQISTPYGNNTETITTEPFSIGGYQYLRFYIDDTTTKSNGVSRGYGHISEFQLFPVTDNPNSQYAQLGEIATKLDAVVEAQKDIEDEDITPAVYDELKAAYDAFMAEVVDPTELRELIARLDGTERAVVVGTNPGFWTDASAGEALTKALNDAKAYNEAGVYTRAQSAAFVEDLTAKSEKMLDGAIGIKTSKWYRFRFATEEEYANYGWATTGAVANTTGNDQIIDEPLFGKYVTPAAYSTEEVEETTIDEETGEESTTKYTLKTVEPVDASEVALGNSLFVDDKDEINDDALTQFRFVAVGDTAYMIQNKATGLFIQATGTTGWTRLSIHPTLFNVKAVGYGQNVIAAKSFTGQNQNFLHVQRSYNTIVTWNASTFGSNSGFFIEEAGDVAADYDGSTFNLAVVPGEVNALCYPVEVSAVEGMYGISKIEGTEVTLTPIEKADGGRPFIYIDGETTDYKEDAEPILVELKHGYDIVTEPDTTSVLIGTYKDVVLKTGDVIASGNSFAVIKDVMQGGLVAANSAYMTAEGTGFKRSDYPTITIDANAPDGIAAAIATVAKTGALYTIDGQLVAKKANLNSLKNMPKGVYILNGTKVTVK